MQTPVAQGRVAGPTASHRKLDKALRAHSSWPRATPVGRWPSRGRADDALRLGSWPRATPVGRGPSQGRGDAALRLGDWPRATPVGSWQSQGAPTMGCGSGAGRALPRLAGGQVEAVGTTALRLGSW